MSAGSSTAGPSSASNGHPEVEPGQVCRRLRRTRGPGAPYHRQGPMGGGPDPPREHRLDHQAQQQGPRDEPRAPAAVPALGPSDLRLLQQYLLDPRTGPLSGSTFKNQDGICSNGVSIKRQVIESRVLQGIKSRLLAGDLVERFVGQARSRPGRRSARPKRARRVS
jgi:hypothetical protein